MARGARRLRAVGTAAGIVAVLASHAAWADVPGVDVRTWTPSVDPRAGLVVEPTTSPGPWSFATGAWVSYANDPVVLREPISGTVSSRPLENQLAVDIGASLGLGTRSLVGVRLPVLAVEQGTGNLPTSIVSSGRVPATSFGDLALVGKGTIVRNDAGGFGLAALGELSLPTGTKTSFLGDTGPTVALRVLADFSTRAVSVQASAGYSVRTHEIEWPSSGGVQFGDSIPWTLGVLVRPSFLHVDPGARQSWELALHGSLPGGPTEPFGAGSLAVSPAMLALSDRVALGHYRDVFVLAGADVGLDRAVGVPSVRAILGVGWRFESHDRDGDGIPDERDQCPTIAEDRDGFEDADGCPEADNDEDRIVDAEDACPNVPGVRSSDPRKNGCPPNVSSQAPAFPPAHDP